MRRFFATISMAALLSASTALAQQAPQPLSITVGQETVSADASSLSYDPRDKRVTFKHDDNKPIVLDTRIFDRVGPNIEAEWRRVIRRKLKVQVDVVEK